MWIKRLVLITITGLIILICVVLFRTWNFGTKQLLVENTELLNVDATRLKQQLSDAITFQTISYRDPTKEIKENFSNFINHLKIAFPLVHQSLHIEIIDNRHLVYHWGGKQKTIKPVLFIAHTDVVPVENDTLSDWRYSPFSGFSDKNYIWGRGSMDNKSSIISMLTAVESLVERGYQPERSIYFEFDGDEETGGTNGAVTIAQRFKQKGLQFEFVLDEGGIISDKIIQGWNNLLP